MYEVNGIGITVKFHTFSNDISVFKLPISELLIQYTYAHVVKIERAEEVNKA